MNTFRLIVSTPDGNLFDGEAEMLSCRAADGDLAILAGHIPLISSVRPGKCRITLPDGSEKTGTLDGGILTVAEDAVTLLSAAFRFSSSFS